MVKKGPTKGFFFPRDLLTVVSTPGLYSGFIGVLRDEMR